MSEYLTGTVSGLSGRVNLIEQTYSYINQQLLQRPDNYDFSQFQIVWNSQLTQIGQDITRLQNQVSVLQNLVINQSLNFTAHTGRSAISGHAGLSGAGA